MTTSFVFSEIPEFLEFALNPRSPAQCSERKIEHDFPDFNEYVYCFITMTHQRVSDMVFPDFIESAYNFLSILLRDQTTQLCSCSLVPRSSPSCAWVQDQPSWPFSVPSYVRVDYPGRP